MEFLSSKNVREEWQRCGNPLHLHLSTLRGNTQLMLLFQASMIHNKETIRRLIIKKTAHRKILTLTWGHFYRHFYKNYEKDFTNTHVFNTVMDVDMKNPSWLFCYYVLIIIILILIIKKHKHSCLCPPKLACQSSKWHVNKEHQTTKNYDSIINQNY